MNFDFETLHQFAGSGCEKYDRRHAIFGTDDVIPLWVADMDFAAPLFVEMAIRKRLEHPAFGYVQPDERHFAAIRGWLERRHGWAVEMDWIVRVPNVVPGMVMAIEAFTQRGDGIIIQPPVYFPFFQIVQDNDRQLLTNPLVERDGRYEMNFEQLEALAVDAKMLLLCNPHNPGGRAWTPDELTRVAEICARHDVLVISDEIHMDLTYPGVRHTPFAEVAGHADFLMLSSPGKTFSVAGIGGGYAVIPNPEIRAQFEHRRSQLHLGNGSIFSLIALESAYEEGDDWPDAVMKHISANRDRVEATLNALPGQPIKAMAPEATYLLWLDCRGLGMNDFALQDFFVQKARLGLSAGVVFDPGPDHSGSGFMRLNLATPTAVIEQAMDRLREAVAGL